MVGSLIDSFNYKKLLARVTPRGQPESMQQCLKQKVQDLSQMDTAKAMSGLLQLRSQFEEIVQDLKTSDRTESLEAQNRESTIVLAKEFNRICTEQNRIGRFVFMSAEESIIGQGVPQARKYADMKREAETFLIN